MTKMLAPIYDLSSVRTKVKVALDFGKENSMYLEMNDIMRKAKYFVLTSQSGSTEYPVTGYEVRRHDSYRKGIIFCSVHASFNTREEADACRRKYRAVKEMKILDADRKVMHTCEY